MSIFGRCSACTTTTRRVPLDSSSAARSLPPGTRSKDGIWLPSCEGSTILPTMPSSRVPTLSIRSVIRLLLRYMAISLRIVSTCIRSTVSCARSLAVTCPSVLYRAIRSCTISSPRPSYISGSESLLETSPSRRLRSASAICSACLAATPSRVSGKSCVSRHIHLRSTSIPPGSNTLSRCSMVLSTASRTLAMLGIPALCRPSTLATLSSERKSDGLEVSRRYSWPNKSATSSGMPLPPACESTWSLMTK
mmetsp:Transcript_14913/g.37927  ORF Transcript_14913/g.37927 Transcript_14913/m.37927 type:complete len:250 (+) Transcript_14913:147-896(+)